MLPQRSNHAQKLNIKWADLNVEDKTIGLNLKLAEGTYTLRDLWLKKSAGTTKGAFRQDVASHDVVMLKMVKQ
ncbi:hypothetical protein [Mucilaginibacter sp.]|uniref:hypothetical protein n=1 Tax=Mucilaginibacter sp. TaxID=1882438 RepID=UPI00326669CA